MRNFIKYPGAAILIILLAASAAADDYFGPQTIQVSGAKKTVRTSFNSPAERAAWVEITNGASGGQRASSVIMVLNGTKLNTRKDINKKVGSTKFPVILNGKNKLKIIVRGRGAKVTAVVRSRNADFSHLAGYGDSILAGFEDGSLVETYQVWNFGSQIANQAGAKFVLPLITEPGLPPRYKIENGQLIFPDPNAGAGYRKNPNEDPDNLAVPGATVWTSLNVARIGATPDPYEIVLGGQRPMMGELKRRNPPFVILWIGSNDILDMALKTNPDRHTSLSDFKRDYEKILQELRTLKTSAVAANLPDVTAIALLHKPMTVQVLFGIPADALLLITDVISLRTDLSPDQYLTPDEVASIRATIGEFNGEIAKLCAKYGIPLVDIYTLSRQWYENGAMVGGRHLTTEWRKGIFSLDGIHPSNTGHAMIANEFIDVINKVYGAGLAKINVAAVLNSDPNRPTSVRSEEGLPQSSQPGFLKEAIRILTHSSRIRRF
jgi:lysophospholipase L1-like esterase